MILNGDLVVVVILVVEGTVVVVVVVVVGGNVGGAVIGTLLIGFLDLLRLFPELVTFIQGGGGFSDVAGTQR